MAKKKKPTKKNKRNAKKNKRNGFPVKKSDQALELTRRTLEHKGHRFVDFVVNKDILFMQCLGCHLHAFVDGLQKKTGTLFVWGMAAVEDCSCPEIAESRLEAKRAEAPSP